LFSEFDHPLYIICDELARVFCYGMLGMLVWAVSFS
jgi:hypothetical protein